jgi:hypothetical protein
MDEEKKPGVTQIPLIHDLVFAPSTPLKPPGKLPKVAQSSSKRESRYPPGYDPDTVDLFKDIVEPVYFFNDTDSDRDTQKPCIVEAAVNPTTELDENLRTELHDELNAILKHLKDHTET